MRKIIILIPVYNDWESVYHLINNINKEIANLNNSFSILIINDASTQKKPDQKFNSNNIHSIKIINMANNKGHARCNAAGLKYIFEKEEFDYVIPMDGDGEDRPEEIKTIVEKIDTNSDFPVVGERIKRSEGLFFQFSYLIHKLLTSVFTGKNIKFGNFTCLSKVTVKKMISEKATWSSFSGALSKLESKLIKVPSIRGKRYHGPSQMNLINLIKHSFSIIAVFKYNVLVRSLLFLIVYLLLIFQKVSIITFLPVIFILFFVIIILLLSKRENIEEYNDCLKNISNIDTIK